MKVKNDRHTFKAFFAKSVLYTVLSIVITCVIVGIYSFNSIDGYINRMIEDKLTDVAVSAAAFLYNEPELFELQPGQEGAEVYQRCLKRLKEIRDATNIRYIYAVKNDEKGLPVFVIDADEDIPNPIGLEYTAEDDEYREIAFNGTHVIAEDTYESEFGDLLSCYAPIRDYEGNVVAIIGVDYGLDDLKAEVNRTFRIYLLICAIIVVGIVSIFMLLENIGYTKTKNLLRDSILGIKNVSTEVSNSSKELQKGNITLSDNTNSSLSAADEMSATIDETYSIIKQNNDNMQKAAEYFKKSTLELQNSEEKMKELDSSISSIKNSSDEIQNIIDVINGIAKKTKILALNAEVEAARVGEAGKGFSVVSKEVGDLALSSEDAARNIGEIINKNIMLTETAVNDAVEVNEALASVTEKITDFSFIINEVSTASSEQEKGLQHLVIAADMIKRTVSSNADLASQIRSSADTLIDMTNDLNTNIDVIEHVAGTSETN